ncbi:2OG-Fe(II) oxygenase [Shewanella sp. C32]|uniref:2OG-Fe(II) oxygenase n=1 Tax=Shewanella electrica TaxID=515560 RepID=A0ABT2FH36_9GAMM|nr:2OG-Fe(II) oxygenase [Shewanella electrica]MCH1923540.1 2OG-Fe(II) oxygenase [Shewanella electrica]MCS4555637.1 2OG-Fe(II) oxygenase [Shewanella electrica]
MMNRFDDALLDTIADALVSDGYLILRDVLPQQLTEALRLRVEEAPVEDFRFAAIGRGGEQQLNHDIRSDRIRWLEPSSEPDSGYTMFMESLREGLNQRLFMGLFDYESHYAWYRPGAFYQKHLDALRGSQNRILTTVFFLNHEWQAEQGGELKLYDEDDQLLHTILPEFGTLVIFLSERFPHEVCPTQRGRGSIAGWFRVSNSHYGF